MTREEAIEFIAQSVKSDVDMGLVADAIEALEQEPTTKNNLGVDKPFYEQMVEYCNEHFLVLVEKDVWEDAEKALATKNDLADDAVSRKAVINQIFYSTDNTGDVVLGSALRERIARLPSVTPQEPQTFRWCTDCKEYDQEKHCCPRWSKVIRNTVEEMKQEYIEREVLDKIRTEIEQARYGLINDGLDVALQILDKYKADKEQEDEQKIL